MTSLPPDRAVSDLESASGTLRADALGQLDREEARARGPAQDEQLLPRLEVADRPAGRGGAAAREEGLVAGKARERQARRTASAPMRFASPQPGHAAKARGPAWSRTGGRIRVRFVANASHAAFSIA